MQFTKQISASFNYSLNDTETKSYNCGQCFASTTGVLSVSGTELPGVPKNKGGVVLEYRDALYRDYDYYVQGDYQYRDGMYDTAANIIKTPSYNLVNFRAGIQSGSATIEAFVLNAFEERYFTSLLFNSDAARGSVNGVVAGLGTKRSYGMRLAYKF